MLQKLPKFLKVAQKTASCPKVAEQLVDRANLGGAVGGKCSPVAEPRGENGGTSPPNFFPRMVFEIRANSMGKSGGCIF